MIERKNELNNKVIEFLDDIQPSLDNYTKLLTKTSHTNTVC